MLERDFIKTCFSYDCVNIKFLEFNLPASSTSMYLFMSQDIIHNLILCLQSNTKHKNYL